MPGLPSYSYYQYQYQYPSPISRQGLDTIGQPSASSSTNTPVVASDIHGSGSSQATMQRLQNETSPNDVANSRAVHIAPQPGRMMMPEDSTEATARPVQIDRHLKINQEQRARYMSRREPDILMFIIENANKIHHIALKNKVHNHDTILNYERAFIKDIFADDKLWTAFTKICRHHDTSPLNKNETAEMRQVVAHEIVKRVIKDMESTNPIIGVHGPPLRADETKQGPNAGGVDEGSKQARETNKQNTQATPESRQKIPSSTGDMNASWATFTDQFRQMFPDMKRDVTKERVENFVFQEQEKDAAREKASSQPFTKSVTIDPRLLSSHPRAQDSGLPSSCPPSKPAASPRSTPAASSDQPLPNGNPALTAFTWKSKTSHLTPSTTSTFIPSNGYIASPQQQDEARKNTAMCEAMLSAAVGPQSTPATSSDQQPPREEPTPRAYTWRPKTSHQPPSTTGSKVSAHQQFEARLRDLRENIGARQPPKPATPTKEPPTTSRSYTCGPTCMEKAIPGNAVPGGGFLARPPPYCPIPSGNNTTSDYLSTLRGHLESIRNGSIKPPSHLSDLPRHSTTKPTTTPPQIQKIPPFRGSRNTTTTPTTTPPQIQKIPPFRGSRNTTTTPTTTPPQTPEIPPFRGSVNTTTAPVKQNRDDEGAGLPMSFPSTTLTPPQPQIRKRLSKGNWDTTYPTGEMSWLNQRDIILPPLPTAPKRSESVAAIVNSPTFTSLSAFFKDRPYVSETAAPAPEAAAPVPKTAAPASETAAPVTKTPAPATKTSASATKTLAPATETAASLSKTAASATKIAAPDFDTLQAELAASAAKAIALATQLLASRTPLGEDAVEVEADPDYVFVTTPFAYATAKDELEGEDVSTSVETSADMPVVVEAEEEAFEEVKSDDARDEVEGVGMKSGEMMVALEEDPEEDFLVCVDSEQEELFRREVKKARDLVEVEKEEVKGGLSWGKMLKGVGGEVW